MAPQPRDRPPSAQAVVDALEALQGELGEVPTATVLETWFARRDEGSEVVPTRSMP
jgi:hypothetical protein